MWNLSHVFQVFFGPPLEVTDPLVVVSYWPGIILSVILITTVYGVNPRRQSKVAQTNSFLQLENLLCSSW